MLSGTGFAPKRDWLGFGIHIPQKKKINSYISEIVIQVSWVSQSLQAAEHEVLQAKNSCCSNLYLRAFLLLNACWNGVSLKGM